MRTWRLASRLALATALGTLLAGASMSPAAAQAAEGGVIAQLRAQGYEEFAVSRTLLGRVHIVAERPGRRREIVFNPTTGEILRDYVEAEDGDSTPRIFTDPNDSGPDGDDGNGSGGGSDDDDGNSGSGGRDNNEDDNSGSGAGDDDDSGQGRGRGRGRGGDEGEDEDD